MRPAYLVAPAAVLAGLFAVAPALAHRDSTPAEYTSDAGRYKVRFPERPREVRKNLSTGPGGRVVPLVTEQADGPAGAVFAVTYADYPESFREVPAKTVLDGVRDGLKGTDGKVTRDDELVLGPDGDKLPGREVRIEAGKNAVRARLFLAGSRLYQVVVSGPKEGVGTKAADEFLKSFEVVK